MKYFFAKGDVVMVTKGHLEGKICEVLEDYFTKSLMVPVYFIEDIEGHDCQGLCEYGHGWYFNHNELKKPSGYIVELI